MALTRPPAADEAEIRLGAPGSKGPWTHEEQVAALINAAGSGGGGGGGGDTPVTATSTLMGASQTVSIPSGAKGWTVSVLTGTITFNGVAGLPVGFSESDPKTLAASIAVTTAASSSAYVRWNT